MPSLDIVIVLFHNLILLKEDIKVESAEVKDNLDICILLGRFMRSYTALDQPVFHRAIKVRGLFGLLRLFRFFRLVWLFRHAKIDLNTVRVAKLDARAAITDNRILEKREYKCWKTQ